MIDIHCHLLPGIDDGARDLESALSMARRAVQDGIREAILTPHHLNGNYINRPDGIRRAIVEFQSRLDAAGIALRVHPGSEIHLSHYLIDALSGEDLTTLGDRGRYILLEFPALPLIPPNARQVIFEIQRRGMGIVLAHPERIPAFTAKPQLLDDLIDAGALIQLTAGSLVGQWGRDSRKFCKKLIEARRVHFIASDAHNLDGRVPELSKAREIVARWAGERAASILFEENPRHLAYGEAVLQ